MPSSDNSTKMIASPISCLDSTPIATSTDTAIGRSKYAPSLVTSAGARFIAIRFAGSVKPIDESAALIRSFDSATALSARPTIIIAGSPFDICACTDTGTVSRPRNATVCISACIIIYPLAISTHRKSEPAHPICYGYG